MRVEVVRERPTARLSEASPAGEGGPGSELALRHGLEAAASVIDRTITTFTRGELPHYAGLNTFLRTPYLEDVRAVGEYDAAVIGVPRDSGIAYRPGTRQAPQGIRRISALYDPGEDQRRLITRTMRLCDLGDIFTIPSSCRKSFDQISRGVAHVFASGALPVILGGDHSIGFPVLRGLCRHVGDRRLGVIHFDRHLDPPAADLEQCLQQSPHGHATHPDHAPARNLVQLGIAELQAADPGLLGDRQRGRNVFSVADIHALGLEATAAAAVERACDGTDGVVISFSIDCLDAGFVPGTGWHEPGGLQLSDVLTLLSLIVPRVPVCALEVVEVSPPHDISDMSVLAATRVISETLLQLVRSGQLPRRTRPAWIRAEANDAADRGWR